MIIALSQNIPNFSMRDGAAPGRTEQQDASRSGVDPVDATDSDKPTPPVRRVVPERVLEWVVRAGCSGEVTWLVA